MSRYLVTGGAGFIGSHLVDKLISMEHEVFVLDNLSTGKLDNLDPAANFIRGDINNYALLKKIMKNCQGCFHLAAIASVEASINQWVEAHKTNLTATIGLLDIAKDLNTHENPFPVVYASSAAVYGISPNCPYKEYDIPHPVSPYGIDKLSCELQAQFAGRSFKLPNTGLRFFNVYGERQDPNSPYSGVISIFAKQIMSQKPLTVYGDGKQVRDFIYVKDIVEYLLHAMQNASDKSPVYNACTSRDVSLNDLIQTLGKVIKRVPEVIYAPTRIGDIKISKGDNRLSQLELDIAANTELYEGLDLMMKKL